jgi:hypothetical protein
MSVEAQQLCRKSSRLRRRRARDKGGHDTAQEYYARRVHRAHMAECNPACMRGAFAGRAWRGRSDDGLGCSTVQSVGQASEEPVGDIARDRVANPTMHPCVHGRARSSVFGMCPAPRARGEVCNRSRLAPETATRYSVQRRVAVRRGAGSAPARRCSVRRRPCLKVGRADSSCYPCYYPRYR